MSDNESGIPRTKWLRSQRFKLSPAGQQAGANYREVIVAARREAGRKSFDAARVEWAARLALNASDGLYLGELENGSKTIAETAMTRTPPATRRADNSFTGFGNENTPRALMTRRYR